ncbi:MAG: hypothetical protein LM514_02185 [Streptococcus sp.]|jgi:hypothetical protein|nr:hypothetical protein [Streptococcus sp.]
MAISNSYQQPVVHNDYSRRARFASLGSLLALTSLLLVDPLWATEAMPSLKDPHVQTIADLQRTDVTPIGTSEATASVSATWQVEIAYVVAEPVSGVSQE